MITIQQVRAALALERNVLVLSGTVFLMLTSLFSWYLLLPLYFRELGATDAQVGLAYSLLTIGFSVMQFAGGLLADRYGRKMPIVLPTFIFAPLYALAGFAQSWVTLLVLLLTINSLSAIQSPAFTSIIAESVPEGRRGMAFGLFEFAVSLGITIGPALGATLLSRLGMRPLIYITAVIALLSAILRTACLHETNRHPSPIELTSLKQLCLPRLRWFLLAAILLVCIYNWTLWGPFVSLHAGDTLGLSKPQINNLFAVGGFACMVASLLGGHSASRFGGRNLLIAAGLGHVVTMVFWSLAGTSPLGLALFVVTNMGLQMAIVAYQTLLTQVTPRASRGTIIGFVGTVTGVVGGIAPTVGAYLRAAFGTTAPFWIALITGFIMAMTLQQVSDTLPEKVIYSIGHSTHSLDELLDLLTSYRIGALVDVRRFPRSRKNPQFNKEALEEQLPARGIEYHWLGESLGGFRGSGGKGGFQGYAAYMETEDFQRGLTTLERIGANKLTAFMCAEKLFFRCHRNLIADALVRRGWRVYHIIEAGREPYEHRLRMAAIPEDVPQG
jgi:MFS family permease